MPRGCPRIPRPCNIIGFQFADRVASRRAGARLQEVRRILVLTDLVDSTGLTASLKTDEAAALFTRIDRLVRDALARCGGIEIDKTDGFLLLFEEIPAALDFALSLHEALDAVAAETSLPVASRTGLHIGMVITRTNSPEDIARGAKPIELEGLAKPLAARIMGLASANQILVTRSIREGVVDLDYRWASCGSYRLKGIVEPHGVWELVRREAVGPPPDGDKAWRASTGPLARQQETLRRALAIPAVRLLSALLIVGSVLGVGAAFRGIQNQRDQALAALEQVRAGAALYRALDIADRDPTEAVSWLEKAAKHAPAEDYLRLATGLIQQPMSTWQTAGPAVYDAEWAPDGAVLATAHEDGRVRFWRPSGELEKELVAGVQPVRELAWSASGDKLAAFADDSLAVWAWPSGEPLEAPTVTGKLDRWAGFSGAGTLAALTGSPGTLHVPDLPVLSRTIAARWTASGDVIAVDVDGQIHRSEAGIWVVSAMDGSVHAAAFNDAGDDLLVASGSVVSIGSPAGKGQTREHRAVGGHGATWSPDGELAALLDGDGAIHLYRRLRGWSRLPIAGTPALLLRWTPGSEYLLAGRASGQVDVIDRAGRTVQTLRGHQSPISALSLSAEHWLTADRDGRMRCWTRAALPLPFWTHPTEVPLRRVAAGGGRRVAIDSAGQASLFGADTIVPDEFVDAALWSMDGSALAVSGSEGTRIWTPAGWTEPVPDTWVAADAWHDTAQRLLIGSFDGAMIRGPSGSLSQIDGLQRYAWSGDAVIGIDERGSAVLIDVGAPVGLGPATEVGRGRPAAVVRAGGAIDLVDPTGEVLATTVRGADETPVIAGHARRGVAIARKHEAVCLWNVGLEEQCLEPKPAGLIASLSWDPTGRMLLAVEADWTAHVWQVDDTAIHLVTWRFSGSPSWDGEALVGPAGASLVRVSLPSDPLSILAGRSSVAPASAIHSAE